MLLIEVDGITHDSEFTIAKDKIRDEELTEVGFTVLRFSSWEVLNRIDNVNHIIVKWIKEDATVEPIGPRKRIISALSPSQREINRHE